MPVMAACRRRSIFAAFDTCARRLTRHARRRGKVVTADYSVPFLAHATMEPMVCTARVEGERAEIWAGMQDPLNARRTAAERARHRRRAGARTPTSRSAAASAVGCPYNLDYVGMGARIAKAMSPTPVKLIWSRENDIQHDYYRPAAMARFAGALDAGGAPLAVRSSYAGGGDGESIFMPYTIADKTRDGARCRASDPTGPWRSVLNSQHGFFKESFIDEMAHAAGKDPYPVPPRSADRSAAFPRRARTSGGDGELGQPAARGRRPRHRDRRELRHHRRRSGARGRDAGRQLAGEARLRRGGLRDVVNLDTATAQAEGGVIFGLSAAMLGEITIAEGRVVQRNFRDSPDDPHGRRADGRVEFIRSGRARWAGSVNRACRRLRRRWPTRSSPPPASACAICRSRTPTSP